LKLIGAEPFPFFVRTVAGFAPTPQGDASLCKALWGSLETTFEPPSYLVKKLADGTLSAFRVLLQERDAKCGSEPIRETQVLNAVPLTKGRGQAGTPHRSVAKTPKARDNMCNRSPRKTLHQRITTCGDCGGRGPIIEETCPKCHGTGQTTQDQTLTVQIPVGVEEWMATCQTKSAFRADKKDRTKHTVHLYCRADDFRLDVVLP
jgi:hypothetical protein